ncbi:uncharacterized protein LOC142547223 [Primulina tabacum]|uniref:uncharacterized protein LOC142547223 n=1 Tax=Primulina tabacum TaxID=48773 RepID=UPI003F59B286
MSILFARNEIWIKFKTATPSVASVKNPNHKPSETISIASVIAEVKEKWCGFSVRIVETILRNPSSLITSECVLLPSYRALTVDKCFGSNQLKVTLSASLNRYFFPEIDVNVGLSDRPPWFCSLCNTKTTSKQTLRLHADGKKQRAKARGFRASKRQPVDAVGTTDLTEKNEKNEVPENNGLRESRDQNSSEVTSLHDNLEVETYSLKSDKKRKLKASEVDGAELNTGGETSTDGNGEVIQIQQTETEESDGVGKLIKLRKFVLKSLKESGFAEDKNQVFEMLEQKISSSSRFTMANMFAWSPAAKGPNISLEEFNLELNPVCYCTCSSSKSS